MPKVLSWLCGLLAVGQIGQSWADDQNNTLCGKSDFYNSSAVPYSFNNNAWGDDGSGFQCMTINDEGTSFSVRYKWTGDASTVKGFPYMKYDPFNLPTALWNISTLQFSGKWRTYVEGTQDQSPEEQAVAYDNIGLKVNAAIDMFLSDDLANSTGLGSPIEIMIWPWFTPNVLPLGHAESTPQIDTVEVGGTNYSLYHGFNAQGQNVFSWLTHKNLTSVDVDYSPLLKHIWKKGLLSGALYVGQLEFGSEIMHAGEDTVFEASDYKLRVYREGDPDDPNRFSSTTALTATPTSDMGRTSTLPASSTASSTSNGAAENAATGIRISVQTSSMFDLALIWTLFASIAMLWCVL